MRTILSLLVVVCLVGCAIVRVTSFGDVALPTSRSTEGHPKIFESPSEVKRKFVEIAEFRMSAGGLELEEIASKFQLKAAQIGADAVILMEQNPTAEGMERYLSDGVARGTAITFRIR